ncbi:hypothetical protein SCHIN_v1c00480 [Spiroplasma chinense]|uniref:Uncharacterized protein n=1 Tax=Spiroplasma chinense TaxID=216932 RepID=A0A5B9Y3J6_9MOLU|nr:hypothetical protein [Spiroplasma chinense]QEH61246.1 hypothetical protein SCHIN_v1c00480 [Spiroplasma chinense]
MKLVWGISLLKRKAFTTLPQIKSYIRSGLFEEKKKNEKYDFDLKKIKRLLYIKMLSELKFRHENIKLILTDLCEKAINDALIYYFDIEKNDRLNFYKNIDLFLNNDEALNIYNTTTFKFLSNSSFAPVLLTRLFISKKNWYEDEKSKCFLKANRKAIYSAFINFNVTKIECVLELIKVHFIELRNFLKERGYVKWIDFLAFIYWLITEPRYIKEMKRFTKINVAKDIFDLALSFIIEETNKEY